MEKSKDPIVAVFIGRGYAHLQNGVDRIIEWGFRKIKKASASDVANVEEKGNRYLRCAGKILRGVLGFAGTAGESFFTTYEELKTKRRKSEPPEA